MRLRTVLVGLLVLTSGCLGFGGDEAESDDPDLESQQTNETDEPDAAVEEPPERTWRTETFEGSVSGAGVLLGLTIVPLSEDPIVNFPAEEGIEVLYLNLTTDGGELDGLVGEPGCEENSGCEESFSTSGGEAQYTNETPVPGEWRLRLFSAEPVAYQISYELEVTQGVRPPAET